MLPTMIHQGLAPILMERCDDSQKKRVCGRYAKKNAPLKGSFWLSVLKL